MLHSFPGWVGDTAERNTTFICKPKRHHMTISSVISGSSRVLHIFFSPSHRRHMIQMTEITSMAHTSSSWAIQAETHSPASLLVYRRPPGRCSPLEPQPTRKALQCLIEFASSQVHSSPPLCFLFLFFTNSFVVLIHHEKGRSHEMTVCIVTYAVKVTWGMNSYHLWPLLKEKTPLFWDHTCP